MRIKLNWFVTKRSIILLPVGMHSSIFVKLQKRQVALKVLSIQLTVSTKLTLTMLGGPYMRFPYMLENHYMLSLFCLRICKLLMHKIILNRERERNSYSLCLFFILSTRELPLFHISTREGQLWSSALVEGIRVAALYLLLHMTFWEC